jgi:hypothetical protein
MHFCVSMNVCVRYNFVYANVFSETENMLQPTVLSEKLTVQCRLLYCLTHRQLHSSSYSYCSHQ